jgi:hypothetical protein
VYIYQYIGPCIHIYVSYTTKEHGEILDIKAALEQSFLPRRNRDKVTSTQRRTSVFYGGTGRVRHTGTELCCVPHKNGAFINRGKGQRMFFRRNNISRRKKE